MILFNEKLVCTVCVLRQSSTFRASLDFQDVGRLSCGPLHPPQLAHGLSHRPLHIYRVVLGYDASTKLEVVTGLLGTSGVRRHHQVEPEHAGEMTALD